jgi:hypothetical protein
MYHWKNFLYCPKLLKSAAEALFKPAHSFLLAFSTIDAGFFIPTVNYFNLEMRLLAYPQGVVKGDSSLIFCGGQDRRCVQGVQPLRNKQDASLKKAYSVFLVLY